MPRFSIEVGKHTHEERLQLAHQFSDKIVQTYKESILAVCVTGSTAKELDRPYSDLEMFAVVKNGVELPTQHYVHDGMVFQVDYFEESFILKDASRLTTEWPLAKDGFRNRIVLFDPHSWFSKLDKVVSDSDRADMNPAIKHGMTGLYEGLSVMLNAKLTNDETGVRTAGFWFAWSAAKLVLMLNHKYILTSSWFWKEATSLPGQTRTVLG